jgi:hypothetical protein
MIKQKDDTSQEKENTPDKGHPVTSTNIGDSIENRAGNEE